MIHDLIIFAHQTGMKVFLCGNTLCIAKNCILGTGKEVSNLEGGTQHFIEMENPDTGYTKEWIPTQREPFIITLTDGTKKIRNVHLNIICGCNNVHE